MSTSVPMDDGGALATPTSSPLLRDEDALHRAFVTEYPTLIAEANADLGDAAAALGPHVVEGAFVRAWDARDRISTPEQLHEFLTEDVHHAAARALSRRAIAHRMARHNEMEEAHAQHAIATVDEEHAWSHILSALHNEAHSGVALAESNAAFRHEAATHIAHVEERRPIWKPLVLGAIALAAVVGIMYWVDRLGAGAAIARAVNAGDAREVTAVPGQVGVVTLADGSTVRLTPESVLRIPKDFGDRMRAVKLLGDGAFQVAPGHSDAFRVYAGNAIVVATGTAFTVRAYRDDSAATVVVTEGSVEVHDGDAVRTLAAGNALTVQGTAMRPATPAERDAADAWRTGRLIVDNRPLGDVLPMLRRWYAMTVTVPQTSLLSRPVTLNASLDSSREAISGIEKSTGLEMGYSDSTMVFREPAAKKRK